MIVEQCSTFWIGLDDTDEREYGCTTHDFNHLLNHLTDNGILISDPRLVRLWPFAPRRTRGNAALAAKIRVNHSSDIEDILTVWFEKRFKDISSSNEAHSAQPVLVLTDEQLPEEIYLETVRDEVNLAERLCNIERFTKRIWSTNAGKSGLIGASAAIAWRGDDDWTWECTVWRNGKKERHVPAMLVDEMLEKYGGTLLNRDPNAGKNLIAPRTPCPVLYGIRGEDAETVEEAHIFLQTNGSELCVDYRVFRSNQATDDHIYSTQKSIVSEVIIMQGGHVQIRSENDLIAFSEGGDVNRLAQNLRIGDEIEWSGLRDLKGTYHLEKVRLLKGYRNRARPLCTCGSRFKSQGKSQPLRCKNCGKKNPDTWVEEIIDSDWKEPHASNRRHLSKPLSRKGKYEV